MRKCIIWCGLLLCAVSAIPAQEPNNRERPQQPDRPPRRGGPGGFGGPIELGPDDKQTYADPPDSIVARRDHKPGARPGTLRRVASFVASLR